MFKYQDQSAIENVVKQLQVLPKEEQESMRQMFFQGRNDAREEVKKISQYTVPEDIDYRQQSLYYYEDVIQKMEWNRDKKVAVETMPAH